MSAAAVNLRDDLKALKGGADLQEWADKVALVMSHTIVTDENDRPLLVLGLDVLQDGDDPNVEARAMYQEFGGGLLGIGGEKRRELSSVMLVATRDIEVGAELTTHYLPRPQGGAYLEQYGFVPPRMLGTFPKACVELSFAPTDPDEDDHFNTKQSLLEDIGMTPEPMSFHFSTEEGFGSPREEQDWNAKSDIDKMTHILRLRHAGGSESFLLDSVYVDEMWRSCSFRLSKENETLVAKAVVTECDRWLERFQKVEDQPRPDSPIAAAVTDVRRGEAELLERIKSIYNQELRDTMVDMSRKYWADRQLDKIFPQRPRRSGGASTKMLTERT